MWNDNETALDLINISHYVSSVVELVNDSTLLPLTVGVFGDWGNGKSSLLKMVKVELDKQDKTLCLYFNGWLFEDYDDAKAALIGTILDEIEKNPTLGAKAKKMVKGLRERVDWLGLAGVVGKYGLSTLLGGPLGGLATLSADAGKLIVEKIKSGEVDDIKKLLKPAVDSTEVRKNIRDFREEFSNLLKESKIERLVVIIDDLDRCLPDTIINTLEAIKLFLSSERTAFLISIDERVIKHAITLRYSNFAPDQQYEISRDYLEKLIQIPLRVPLMSRGEMKTYINLLFASKSMVDSDFQALLTKVNDSRKGDNFNTVLDIEWFNKNAVISDELKEELMISEQINDLLYDFLKGNPRQVKRFINSLLLRMKLARLRGVDLKKQMLAKLMALEYMHISYFQKLSDWQSTQNGKPTEIKDLETRAQKENPKKIVEDDKLDWLQNEWLGKWLRAEPYLANINLEPYFYISRDSITYLSTQSLKLTESEKNILNDLISQSATHKDKGKKSFEGANDVEVINITNALIEKCRKTDFKTDDTDILLTATSLVNIKPVITENIIDFIGLIDDAYIQPAVVLELKTALKGCAPALETKINQLLDKFRKSKNTMLAKAVDS